MIDLLFELLRFLGGLLLGAAIWTIGYRVGRRDGRCATARQVRQLAELRCRLEGSVLDPSREWVRRQ